MTPVQGNDGQTEVQRLAGRGNTIVGIGIERNIDSGKLQPVRNLAAIWYAIDTLSGDSQSSFTSARSDRIHPSPPPPADGDWSGHSCRTSRPTAWDLAARRSEYRTCTGRAAIGNLPKRPSLSSVPIRQSSVVSRQSSVVSRHGKRDQWHCPGQGKPGQRRESLERVARWVN